MYLLSWSFIFFSMLQYPTTFNQRSDKLIVFVCVCVSACVCVCDTMIKTVLGHLRWTTTTATTTLTHTHIYTYMHTHNKTLLAITSKSCRKSWVKCILFCFFLLLFNLASERAWNFSQLQRLRRRKWRRRHGYFGVQLLWSFKPQSKNSNNDWESTKI